MANQLGGYAKLPGTLGVPNSTAFCDSAQSPASIGLKWYSDSGHLEKHVIGKKLLEVNHVNREKELFRAI